MKTSLISFPLDEAPHKDRFEWWYWNANIKDAVGSCYSVMFTLFKGRPIPLPNLWSTHSIISSCDGKRSSPRFDFFSRVDHSVWNADGFSIGVKKSFEMKRTGPKRYAITTPDLRLQFTALKPPIFIGGTGHLDLKSSKTFYYSLPRLDASGSIRVGSKWIHVKGHGWMDHQWNPISMSRENVWKWFSFHLSDGTDLVCFEFGRTRFVRLATISTPDGSQIVSREVSFRATKKPWKSPETGLDYHLSWDISIPDAKIVLRCTPDIEWNEMIFGPIFYWEGSLRVTGAVNGKRITGVGFFENVPTTDVAQHIHAFFKGTTARLARAVRSAARDVFTRAD